MLIALYRSKNPVLFFYLPLIAAALWWSSFTGGQGAEPIHNMPLYRLFAATVGMFPVAATLFSISLLSLQAILLNSIVNEGEIHSESNNLCALLYLPLMSISPELLCMHPLLFSNLFLILALRRLLVIYREEKVFSPVCDTGFFTGIASLFYFPASLMLLFVWISLLVLRPFIWREWIIALIGFLLPWFFALTWFIWRGELPWLWNECILPAAAMPGRITPLPAAYYLPAVFLAFLLFLSWLGMSRGLQSRRVKARKSISVMTWFLIFSILSLFLTLRLTLLSFAAAAIPLSAFLGFLFLPSRGAWWREALFALFIAAILFSQFSGYR